MEEIEKYAKENRIPIMQKDGILYLVNYIKENKITNILEKYMTRSGLKAGPLKLIDVAIS